MKNLLYLLMCATFFSCSGQKTELEVSEKQELLEYFSLDENKKVDNIEQFVNWAKEKSFIKSTLKCRTREDKQNGLLKVSSNSDIFEEIEEKLVWENYIPVYYLDESKLINTDSIIDPLEYLTFDEKRFEVFAFNGDEVTLFYSLKKIDDSEMPYKISSFDKIGTINIKKIVDTAKMYAKGKNVFCVRDGYRIYYGFIENNKLKLVTPPNWLYGNKITLLENEAVIKIFRQAMERYKKHPGKIMIR